ncbi:MAG: hypothetical protein WCO45_06575 [Pseudanabaena sp. ELA607]|jgi:hypothetical protein
MAETSPNPSAEANPTTASSHHEGLYAYAKATLDKTQQDIDTLGSKLAGVMEISALLLLGLRVTSSFHNYVPPQPPPLYFSYLALKLTACTALAIAIMWALWGLYPRKPNPAPLSPETLATANWQEILAHHWLEQNKNLETYQQMRQRLLRRAVTALGLGILIATLATTDAVAIAIVGHD